MLLHPTGILLILIIIMQFLNNKILILYLLFIINAVAYPQFINYSDFSFSLSGNYISSASIQLYSNSSDPIERNLIIDTKGGYGFGISIGKKIFNDDISLSISSEYLKIIDKELTQTVSNDSSLKRFSAEEELLVFPVELSILYKLPEFISSTNILIGGGIGTYFGNRIRRFANLETETISSSPEFTLHIIFSIEYYLTSRFAANFNLKFREGKYNVKNRFPTNQIIIGDEVFYFPQEYDSKVYIDGLKVGIGFTYFLK